jgi:hypothetical protein
VIGFLESDIPSQFKVDGVYFYGYLDKSLQHDFDIYYKLLSEATIFINTIPGWDVVINNFIKTVSKLI